MMGLPIPEGSPKLLLQTDFNDGKGVLDAQTGILWAQVSLL